MKDGMKLTDGEIAICIVAIEFAVNHLERGAEAAGYMGQRIDVSKQTSEMLALKAKLEGIGGVTAEPMAA